MNNNNSGFSADQINTLFEIKKSLDNINNNIQKVANVFYGSINQDKKEEKDLINKQINIFNKLDSVVNRFNTVINNYQRQTNNQNFEFKKLFSYIKNAAVNYFKENTRNIILSQNRAFDNLSKYLKSEQTYKSKQANEISNLFKYFKSQTKNLGDFYKNIIKDIDELYSEQNYLKAIADNTRHIAEVFVLLKPYIRSAVAQGRFDLIFGSGLHSNTSNILTLVNYKQGILDTNNFSKLLALKGKASNIEIAFERYVSDIYTTITDSTLKSLKLQLEDKIPWLANKLIRKDKDIIFFRSLKNNEFRNALQEFYVNINSALLNDIIKSPEDITKFIYNFKNTVSIFTDKTGKIDKELFNNVIKNLNTLDKLNHKVAKDLLQNLDNYLLLRGTTYQSLETFTNNLKDILTAYQKTVSYKLTESDIKRIYIEAKNQLIDATIKLQKSQPIDYQHIIDNIINNANIVDQNIKEQITSLLSNDITNYLNTIENNLRYEIYREFQLRGNKRKVREELIQKLGGNQNAKNLVNQIAREFSFNNSKLVNLSRKIAENKYAGMTARALINALLYSKTGFSFFGIGSALGSGIFSLIPVIGGPLAPIVGLIGGILFSIKGFSIMRYMINVLKDGVNWLLNTKYIKPIKDAIVNHITNILNTIKLGISNALLKIKHSLMQYDFIRTKIAPILSFIKNKFSDMFGGLFSKIKFSLNILTKGLLFGDKFPKTEYSEQKIDRDELQFDKYNIYEQTLQQQHQTNINLDSIIKVLQNTNNLISLINTNINTLLAVIVNKLKDIEQLIEIKIVKIISNRNNIIFETNKLQETIDAIKTFDKNMQNIFTSENFDFRQYMKNYDAALQDIRLHTEHIQRHSNRDLGIKVYISNFDDLTNIFKHFKPTNPKEPNNTFNPFLTLLSSLLGFTNFGSMFNLLDLLSLGIDKNPFYKGKPPIKTPGPIDLGKKGSKFGKLAKYGLKGLNFGIKGLKFVNNALRFTRINPVMLGLGFAADYILDKADNFVSNIANASEIQQNTIQTNQSNNIPTNNTTNINTQSDTISTTSILNVLQLQLSENVRTNQILQDIYNFMQSNFNPNTPNKGNTGIFNTDNITNIKSDQNKNSQTNNNLSILDKIKALLS